MKPNKLFNLLQSLTIKEFKELEGYMNSPFFIKKRTDLPAFYQALKPFYPFTEIETVTKEALFEQVYSEEDFKDKKFRKLLADFVKIIENYLLFLENEVDRFEKNKRLMAIYKRRNVHQEFLRTAKELTKTLNKVTIQNATYFYNQYILESELYFHSNVEKNKGEVNTLKNSIKNFEHFFVLERAKLGMDLKNKERIYSKSHHFKLDDFSKIIPIDNTIYEFYKISLQLFETEKEAIFFNLKDSFLKNFNDLEEGEQLIFFKVLQNYAIQKARISEEEYLPILLDLFKMGLERGILLDNGMIRSVTFLNIIGIAIKNNKTDWANLIIETYKDKIIEEISGFTYKASTALIAFYKKEYIKVIDILNISPFPHSLNYYSFKMLIIRASFKIFQEDANYYKLFLNHSSSFEKYLTRDNLSVSKKIEANLEFIREIKKIGKLIFQRKLTPTLKIQLLENLEKNEKINYKNWLIKTIQEINCP